MNDIEWMWAPSTIGSRCCRKEIRTSRASSMLEARRERRRPDPKPLFSTLVPAASRCVRPFRTAGCGGPAVQTGGRCVAALATAASKPSGLCRPAQPAPPTSEPSAGADQFAFCEAFFVACRAPPVLQSRPFPQSNEARYPAESGRRPTVPVPLPLPSPLTPR
jgi:hypothetical protein